MFDLRAQDVHCWVLRTTGLSLDDLYIDKLTALLDENELARFKRFKFDQHRRQFALAHAFTRQVLSHYADLGPADWTFQKNEYGKPFVSNLGYESIHFNLSHTKGMLLMAVSLLAPLGVDVEYRDPKVKGPRIAHRFFSEQEVSDLHKLQENCQYHRFFDYWALKESYIKACGKGLAIPLGKFSFSLGQCIKVTTDVSLEDDDQRWYFSLLDLGSEHAVALAVGASVIPKLSLHSLRPLDSAKPEKLTLRDPRDLQILLR